MEEEKARTGLLDTLSSTRKFALYLPDPSEETVRENKPYVLRIPTSRGAEVLDVIQLDSPISAVLPGLPAQKEPPMYALLEPPAEAGAANIYIVSRFPGDEHFPWQGGGGFGRTSQLLTSVVGVTSHTGVPLLHVRIEAPTHLYEEFEGEVQEIGYTIIPAKEYRGHEMLLRVQAAHQEGRLEELLRRQGPVAQGGGS